MIRAHREHGFASLGVLGLILAVATVALPVAMPSAAPNPCTGRLICGPVHLWPHGAAPRQRLIAQIIASFITARAAAAANRPQSVSVPYVDKYGAPLGVSATFSRALVVTGARPPSFTTSLFRYLALDAAEHAVQSTFRVSDLEQQRWARFEAFGAFGDTLRWHSVFAANHELKTDAVQCQQALSAAHAFVLIAPHTPIVPVVQNGRPPANNCAPFIGNSFGFRLPGSPIVFEGSSAPIMLPTAHVSAGERFSLLALAAQAIVVPSAHAIRDVGPIHLLPRDPSERGALLLDLGTALVDGIITQHGTHGDPRLEADPVVRPFVRGGLTSMMAAWTAQIIVRRSIFHSTQLREAVDHREAALHILGVGSWLSPITYGWGDIPPSLALKAPQTEARWFYLDDHLPKGRP